MNVKKKRRIVVILLIAIIAGIIYLYFRPKSYEKSYRVSDMPVSEEYDSKRNLYRFSTVLDDKEYDLVLEAKYTVKRKLISEVEVMDFENESCVYLKSEQIDSYPICYKDDARVDYDLISNKDESYFTREAPTKEKDSYKNITVYSDDEKSYLIWNHKGYYFLNSKAKEEFNFLEEESYYNKLSIKVGEYVMTPNYDEEYAFKSFYLFDMKKGQMKKWEFKEEISLNSYYLGEKDGIAYLVDRKNKREYAIDPKRKKIEIVDKDGMGRVWDDEWVNYSMTKLINSDFIFENKGNFTYFIDENKLFMQNALNKDVVLVSEKDISKLVDIDRDDVYYLVGSELYVYNPRDGEKKLLEYSEFNFNDINSIFIY